jgi:hypothetical protein
VTRRGAAWLLAAVLLGSALAGLAWYLRSGRGEPAGTAASGSSAAATTVAGERARPGATAAPTSNGGAATPGGTQAGGGQAAGAAPSCSDLLTTAEAAAALGRRVARTETRDGFLVRYCTFTGGDRYLVVQVDSGAAASPTGFQLSRRPGDRTVTGIGDAARFTPDTGLLDVLDGSARFQVGLLSAAGGHTTAEPSPRLLAVARAVASRV